MRNKSQNSRLKRKAEKRKPGEVHILWQFKGHTLRKKLKTQRCSRSRMCGKVDEMKKDQKWGSQAEEK